MNAPLFLSKQQDILTYEPSEELSHVFDMAFSLGRPLLLSGKPGTGKTQFAHWLAGKYLQQRNYSFNSAPLIFNTKSTSVHTDLFYTYDAVSHFRNQDPTRDISHFIDLTAMGLAIVCAKNFLNIPPVYSKVIEKAKKRLADEFNGQVFKSSVVLIDEVDKAPRDFPNDLLSEIEQSSFIIKELSTEKIALEDDERQNITVILTSNSEKNLPDAFLRRCAYYHIEFPDAQALKGIILRKLESRKLLKQSTPSAANNGEAYIAQLEKLLQIFMSLNNAPEILKKPSTAECIEWIYFLDSYDLLKTEIDSKNFRTSLSLLIKNVNDRNYALSKMNEWKSKSSAQVTSSADEKSGVERKLTDTDKSVPAEQA